MEWNSIQIDPSELIETADHRSRWISKILIEYATIGWCITNLTEVGLSLIYCMIKYGNADTNHLFYAFHYS